MESKARELKLNDDDRKALCEKKYKPIVKKYKKQLNHKVNDVLPNSPLGQVIGYTLRNWEALNRYLENKIIILVRRTHLNDFCFTKT